MLTPAPRCRQHHRARGVRFDYFVELGLTDDRRAYLRGEWISAVIVVTSAMGVVPSLATIGGFRLLRGVPVLRALIGVVRVIAIGGVAAGKAGMSFGVALCPSRSASLR